MPSDPTTAYQYAPNDPVARNSSANAICGAANPAAIGAIARKGRSCVSQIINAIAAPSKTATCLYPAAIPMSAPVAT